MKAKREWRIELEVTKSELRQLAKGTDVEIKFSPDGCWDIVEPNPHTLKMKDLEKFKRGIVKAALRGMSMAKASIVSARVPIC